MVRKLSTKDHHKSWPERLWGEAIPDASSVIASPPRSTVSNGVQSQRWVPYWWGFGVARRGAPTVPGLGRRSLSLAPTTLVTMATPTTPQAVDRLGNPLPAAPSVEDIERHADGLRVVPDAQLSPETISRVRLEELERRRLGALGG